MNYRFSISKLVGISLSASLVFNSSISIASGATGKNSTDANDRSKNAVIATAVGLTTGTGAVLLTETQLKKQKQSLAEVFATAAKSAPPTASFPSPSIAFDKRPLIKGDIFVAEGIDRSDIEKRIENEKAIKAQLEKNSGKSQSDVEKMKTQKEIAQINQKIAELKKMPGRSIQRTIVITKNGTSNVTPESLVQLFKDKFKNFTPNLITERIQMVQTAPFRLANSLHDSATKKLTTSAFISIVVAGVTYHLLEKNANQEKIAEASIRHLTAQQSPNNKSGHGKDYDNLLPNSESSLGIPNSVHHLKSNNVTDATQDMVRASGAAH